MIDELIHTLNQRPGLWKMEDFAGIDQLHLGGCGATLELLKWLPRHDETQHEAIGLDIGCGLGGTSRLAAEYLGYQMVGIDLNSSYIKAATLLNQSLDPKPNCSFVVGNALQAPFKEQSLSFVISQHACMNIAEKHALLSAVYDQLRPKACLLVHEIMLSPNEQSIPVTYPTPFAKTKEQAHLCQWHTFKSIALEVGFAHTHFVDATKDALVWMNKTREKSLSTAKTNSNITKAPFSPAIVLGQSAGLMSKNMLKNLQSGALQVVSACFQKH